MKKNYKPSIKLKVAVFLLSFGMASISYAYANVGASMDAFLLTVSGQAEQDMAYILDPSSPEAVVDSFRDFNELASSSDEGISSGVPSAAEESSSNELSIGDFLAEVSTNQEDWNLAPEDLTQIQSAAETPAEISSNEADSFSSISDSVSDTGSTETAQQSDSETSALDAEAILQEAPVIEPTFEPQDRVEEAEANADAGTTGCADGQTVDPDTGACV